MEFRRILVVRDGSVVALQCRIHRSSLFWFGNVLASRGVFFCAPAPRLCYCVKFNWGVFFAYLAAWDFFGKVSKHAVVSKRVMWFCVFYP